MSLGECSSIDYLSGVIGWSLGAYVLVYVVLYHRFLRRLSQRHRAEWGALGQPGLIGGDGTSIDWAAYRFFWNRRYRALGDRDLRARGDAVFEVSIVGVALVTILIVLAMVGSHRWAWLGMECVWHALN